MNEDIRGYVCHHIVIDETGGVEFSEGITIDNNDILCFTCKWRLGPSKYLIDEENIEIFILIF